MVRPECQGCEWLDLNVMAVWLNLNVKAVSG